MANKPFEIQSSTLTIGGVDLQAGSNGVVIPGVTRAATFKVEEVDERDGNNPDTFGSNEGAVTVIDNAEYLYLVNDGDVASGSYVAATYSVDELDDGQIESINVESDGVFAAADKTRVEAGNMWATTTPTPFVSFNSANWTQIPFRPKIQANTVELESGGTTLPSQTGQEGKFLRTDGSAVSWVAMTGDTDPTVSYKGFRAVYARMYIDEPTISKVLIYQDTVTTTPTLEVDTDTSRDLFKVSGLANSNVIALVNIFGSDDTYPTSLSTLQHFAKSIIDNVILDNGDENTNDDVYGMRSRFYDNFDTFASRAGNRYKNFEFLREEWFDISGTGGSGTGATFDLFRDVHSDLIDNVNTNQGGINYQVGNVITISGASLGGTTPANNVVITVSGVGEAGQIQNYDYTGILPANTFPLDNIDDGGDDQYDGANYIFTNIQGDSYIAYADEESVASEGVWAVNYNGGNVNESGAAWFGAGSEYVVTYNDSIFGLFVTGANINWIATNGNSGFDGDGRADTGSLQLVDTDGLINGNQTFVLNADGSVTFPDGTTQTTAYTEGDPNVWVQDFESTNIGVPTDTVATANSVEYLSNGDIVAVFQHYYEEGSGTYNSIGRFTPTGEKVWSMKFQGNIYTSGWGLAVDNNSNYIFLAGESSGNTGYSSAVLTKLAQADGAIIWSKTYDVGYNNSNVVVDVTGTDVVVVGYADNGTDNQIVTTKIHGGTGEVLWSKALDGQGDDEAYGMAVDNNNNGDIVTVGYIAEIEVAVSHGVTPLTGSATDVLVIDRADLAGDTLTTSWTVSGTGITGTAGIGEINIYNALTGTVREGSGATFNIINNGNGTYSAGIETGGTNYLVGHKIKILGTSLTGQENTTSYGAAEYGGGYGAWKVTDDGAGNTYLIFPEPAGSTQVTSLLSVGDAIIIEWSSTEHTTTIAAALGAVPNDPYLATFPNSVGYLLTDNFGVTGQPDLNVGYVITGNGTYAAGATPDNDIIITVDSITGSGIIDGVSNSGTAAGTTTATATELPGTNYNVGSGLSFDFVGDSNSTYTEHTYNIFAGGTNYANGDVVVIPGTQLGGTSPYNDLTTTVSAVDGVVTGFNTFSGNQQTATYRISVANSTVDFSGVGTWTLNGTTVDQDDRMVVVKYDSNGAIVWQRAVQVEPGYNCKGADADIDGNGNIYVCGNFDYDNNGGTNQAMILIKFNRSGTKQWTRKVQGPCEDYASSVVVGPDNCLYLSAFTASAGEDYSMVIAKYNLDGTVAWQRLLDSLTNWTFAGQFFFGNGGGSTIAVRDGYVAVVGSVANFDVYTAPRAIIAQFGTDGKIFTRGDYDFKAATFSGLLNTTASNITVSDPGKVSSEYDEEFTIGDFEPDFDLTSDLAGTVYRKINAGNELVNGNYTVSLNANGSVTLPAGGTVSEGYVTSNPTIQLTPARPDVASQKLVIKGGGIGYYTENGIEVEVNDTVQAVGETLTVNVYSDTYANQTLYWWINPEGVGIGDTESGTVELDGATGNFSILVDSDDYEFRVRVSPEDHNYGPGVVGAQSALINSSAPAFDYEHHLHLTTGNLTETSIFLGTDDHNVRTTVNGGIQITTPNTTNNVWNFDVAGDLNLPENGGIVFDRADTSIRVGMGFHIASGEGISLDAIDQTAVLTLSGAGNGPVNQTYNKTNGTLYTGNTFNFVTVENLGGTWYVLIDGDSKYTSNDLIGWALSTGPGPVPVGVLSNGYKSWGFSSTGNLTLPNDAVIRTDGSNVEVGGVTNFNVEAAGVVNIYTNDGAHQWQFGDDGSLTLPGAVVKSTVAKTGVVLPTTTGVVSGLSHDYVLSGLTDGTYGPFTLTGVTLSVTVFGGVINGFSNVSGTATVNDVLGTIDSGDVGGTAGTTITITVSTVVQATPTALDLTKSVNKLTTGYYTLADGVEGQVMHLVRQTGATVSITVIVANARVASDQYTAHVHYPFTTGDMNMLIFTDGAWQAMGGSWD